MEVENPRENMEMDRRANPPLILQSAIKESFLIGGTSGSFRRTFLVLDTTTVKAQDLRTEIDRNIAAWRDRDLHLVLLDSDQVSELHSKTPSYQPRRVSFTTKQFICERNSLRLNSFAQERNFSQFVLVWRKMVDFRFRILSIWRQRTLVRRRRVVVRFRSSQVQCRRPIHHRREMIFDLVDAMPMRQRELRDATND